MTGQHQQQNESELDIDYYFRLLWYKKGYLIFIALLTAALVYFFLGLFAPKYTSTTSLLIESNVPKTVEIEDFYAPGDNNDDYFQTQVELLKSRSLAQEVIKILELERHPEFIIPRLNEWASFRWENFKKSASLEYDQQEIDQLSSIIYSEDRIVNGFQKHLTIVPVNRSKLISVNFKSINPELAAKIANLIAAKYIDIYLNQKAEITKEVATKLSTKLDDLKLRLNTSEQALITFERLNGLREGKDNRKQLKDSKLDLLIKASISARNQYDEALVREEQAHNLINSPTIDPLDIPDSLNSETTRLLKQQYITASNELSTLKLRLQDSHPDVIQQEFLLQTQRTQILAEIKKSIDSLSYHTELAKRNYALSQQALTLHRNSIIKDNDQKIAYDRLTAEVEQNKSLFETFAKRIREAQEAEGLGFVAARIIEHALVPTIPSGPRKILIYIAAILVALSFSSSVILLTDIFNRKIRYAEKFEKQSGLQCIGAVPHVKNSPGKDHLNDYITERDKPRFLAFSQALKNITMRLYSKHMDQFCQVYMVTSSLPDEGKSTIALNLAVGFSRYKRTLLIDTDVRRPSLSNSLGYKDQPGLSSLAEKPSLKNLLRVHPENAKLFILSAGQSIAEPVPLLMSEELEHAIKRLTPKFHRIVLDTAPVLAVNDALLLSRLADHIVFVTKANKTPAQAAKQAINKFDFCMDKFEGFILTDVRESDYKHVEGYDSYRNYASYYQSHGNNSKG